MLIQFKKKSLKCIQVYTSDLVKDGTVIVVSFSVVIYDAASLLDGITVFMV